MSRIRLCPSGKWSFALEEEARRRLAVDGSKPDHLHGKGHAPVRIYRCPMCRFWHLTSRKRLARRAAV
jgi:hypothetical protein